MKIMLKIKSIKKTTEKQLTEEQLQHLRFLLQPYGLPAGYDGDIPEWMEKDYFSYISFAYNDPSDTEKPFHGYAGYIRSDDADDSFDRFYTPLPAVDLYCCPNGFSYWLSRAQKNLISIQNIVIDLDAHDSSMSTEELQAYIKAFAPKLLDKLIIQPNFINFTGRGLHLWYCLEPCSVRFSKQIKMLTLELCEYLSSVLRALGEEVLEVDEGASKRITGLYRVPYTYNTKTGTWGSGLMLHYDRLHMNLLAAMVSDMGYRSPDRDPVSAEEKYYTELEQTIKQRKIHQKFTYIHSSYRGCFVHRKRFIESILYRGNVYRRRTRLLFALFHAVYNLMYYPAAEDYIKRVNESLPEPLTERELEDGVIKPIVKTNYKFKNDTFLGIINATPAEIKRFNQSLSKKAQHKEKAAAAKNARDELILQLHNEGLNVSAIAKQVGCARNTVYKILKK